jgi:hypothetical protein
MGLGNAHDVEYWLPGHQVRIQAKDPTGLTLQRLEEFCTRAKGAIKDGHTETAAPQVSRDIQEPEGRIRLHDGLFFFVLAKKIAVSEQHVGHT